MLTIASFELLRLLKSKAYWISIFVVPILFSIPMIINLLLSDSVESKIKIGVKGENNINLISTGKNSDYIFEKYNDTAIYKLVIISSSDSLNFIKYDYISPFEEDKIVSAFFKSEFKKHNANIIINTSYATGVENKISKSYLSNSLSFFLGLLSYLIMIAYVNYVTKSMLEEKKNKLIEILNLVESPASIIMGKLSGLLFAVVVQLLFYIVFILVSFKILSEIYINKSYLNNVIDTTIWSNISIGYIAILLFISFIFIVIGLVLNGLIATIIVSCQKNKSSNNITSVFTNLLNIIGIYIAMMLATNPTNPFLKKIALFPFVSTIAMPVSIAYSIETIPLVISVFSAVLTILILFIIAVKSYKNNIL